MHRLPDGSGFFVMEVGGPRPPGLVNWVKYTERASARRWLWAWRNYRSAREMSRWPGLGPPIGRLHAAAYALDTAYGTSFMKLTIGLGLYRPNH